jgi:RHS repeat-associated protein
MSQAKPDDPVNRSAPRVVLLATDRSQSIIGEIVDGQAKTIAYSAYGEQSAQQKVETRLGFNGQLREADIGWYLLGNGYRAYNPRLMRFHSPDSWSPFRGGGLNAYMYCVGDPVNRVDPTGHAPLFPGLPLGLRKFVSRVDGFLFGGAEHTGSKGIANNSGFAAMRPEKTGEGTALLNVGAMVAVQAPIKKTRGLYPGGDVAPQNVGGWEPQYGGTPWRVSSTTQGGSSLNANHRISSATRRATNPGSPQHMNTTTTPLWNSNTKAAAFNHQSSTTVYPVGVGSPSPSGPVTHGSTASSSVRPSTSSAVGSSTHSSSNRPTAAVAAIRRDPPPSQRSPSPSPPTSRDSTPPRSPIYNRRYGPNGDRYT